MDKTARPYRSVLYIPGSKQRALEKARDLPVDAIIFDLEDAVAIDEKSNARKLLTEMLETGGYGPRAQIVRVNGQDTQWGADDLAAVAEIGPQAVLLPKVESIAQINSVARVLDAHPACADTQIWAMMETPRGILHAAVIATGPRMTGFVMGTNDLAKELNCRFRPDRLPLQSALQTCLMAARAAGIVCIDGVYNAFKDEAGFRAECEQGRDLGMDGKTLIHPNQLPVADEIFSPSAAEVEQARKILAAFALPENASKGVISMDGRMVERLHAEMAERVVAIADAIAAKA